MRIGSKQISGCSAALQIPLSNVKAGGKIDKGEISVEAKTTKRKQHKKNSNEVNSTLIATLGIDTQDFYKENSTNAKSKTKNTNKKDRNKLKGKGLKKKESNAILTDTMLETVRGRTKDKLDLTLGLKDR